MTQARAAGEGARAHPPPPEPLPADALDAHSHLDLLDQPVGEVLAAARAAGITRVVTVGVDVPTSQWSARCAAETDGVYAAVAVHPNETAKVGAGAVRGRARSAGAGKAARGGGTGRAAPTPAQRDAALAEIAALAALPQVRAVGETGLDYYWDDAPPPLQQEWFRAHIEIAKQANKPLMIHDRDAHDDILRILDDDGPPEQVIFHCFSGDAAMAKRCADAGYVMSFAGTVTFRNAPGLREAAAAAPASLILAETDSPYLTPMPYRGRPNTPAMVAHTVRCLAEVRQISVADMCALITATGERMFGPW